MPQVIDCAFELDPRVWMVVHHVTEQGCLRTYSIVLVVAEPEALTACRLYDNAHGINEMHRYTRDGGKQPGVPFHDGTPAEAMNAAKRAIRRSWREMVDAWKS